MENYMELKVKAIVSNEVFIRNSVAAFCADNNPSVETVGDIKTAVSEAVSNCIVHAYKSSGEGEIMVKAWIVDGSIHIDVFDNGCGIADVNKALEPYFTTADEKERAGIGFMIMGAFMDDMTVESELNCGTKVSMTKKLA